MCSHSQYSRSVTHYQKVKPKSNSTTALLFQKGSKGMVEAKAWVSLFFQLSLLSYGFIRQAKMFYKTNQSHTAGFSAPPAQQESVCLIAPAHLCHLAETQGLGCQASNLPSVLGTAAGALIEGCCSKHTFA